MKYSLNLEKDGYQKITDKQTIDFNDDILYFKNIVGAYKYLYYAQNNKFVIEVDEKTLNHLHALNLLVRHGANLEFIPMNHSIQSKLLIAKLKFFVIKAKLKKQLNFCPPIHKVAIGDEEIYVLEGYVIHNLKQEYTGTDIYGFKSLNTIPIPTKEVKSNKRIVKVESEQLLSAYSETYDYAIFGNQLERLKFVPKYYVYDIKQDTEETVLSIFLQGYNYYQQKFSFECTEEIEITASDDWKYYSKKSHLFKKQFIKIRVKSKQFEIQANYDTKIAIACFSRHVKPEVIIDDLYIELKLGALVVTNDVEKHKTNEYRYYENLKLENFDKEIYLFQDRSEKADDNAEAMYRYYMNNTDKDIYFVVSKNCPCWGRLEKQGFKLIDFGSNLHKQLYVQAKYIVSSHAARRIYDPFYPSLEFRNLEERKFIFLQHGIIMGNHHGFLDKVNTKIDLFITSIDQEKKIVEQFSGYDNIRVTGLPRFDNYKVSLDMSENYILYAPSWNVTYVDNLADSKYKREIEKVLLSPKINKILEENKLKLKLVLHPEVINLGLEFTNVVNVEVVENESFLYSKILRECKLLITDYSSLFFDILYQQKPVILHKPYELHHQNQRLNGYQQLVYQTYEIEQLEDVLRRLSNDKVKLTDQQKIIATDFFKLKKNSVCEAVYVEVEKLN